MNRSQSIFLLAVFLTPLTSDAAQIIQRSSGQTSFSLPIVATELDRYTGTFYILNGGDDSYTLATAGRDDRSFSPLAESTPFAGSAGNDLTLIHRNCEAATHLAATIQENATTLSIINLSDQSIATSPSLIDAASTTIARTTKLASSSDCLFARTVATGMLGASDEPDDSGIATLQPDATVVQGANATPSVRLDRTSTQVFQGAPLRALTVRNLYWDECLQTLYAGLTIFVDADTQSGENVGYGVVKGTITDTCILSLQPITGRQPDIDTVNGIFAVRPSMINSNDGVQIHHAQTMHTSTGLSYLIINGGVFNSSQYLVTNTNADGGLTPINEPMDPGDLSGNMIRALPLGSNPRAAGCATHPLAGCIVDYQCTSAAVQLCSENPCTKCTLACAPALNTDLADNFTITDCASVVGGSNAPWQATQQAIYTGPDIAYYTNAGDSAIVSNVEDPAAGDAQGNAGNGTLVLRLVQNVSRINVTQPASDLFVLDDAVYVSSGSQTISSPLILQSNGLERIINVDVCIHTDTRDTNNDVGLWVTQALFDHAGCVVGWTPWERAYPTTGDPTDDSISFFAVDGQTGKIWKVSNLADDYDAPLDPYCTNVANLVCRTAWHIGTGRNGSLQSALNAVFNDPCKAASCSCPAQCGSCVVCESETKSTCCSTKCGNCCTCCSPACGTTGIFTIRDLAGNTTFSQRNDGFAGTTSYALFGGFEKVAFARTKQANNIPTDPAGYNSSDNFYVTTLPSGAGAIYAVGYTYRHGGFANTAQRNFFYAATECGLYAYAQADGSAFNTNTNPLDALNAAPFDQSSDQWHRISATAEHIITAAENDGGNGLYYIATDACNCPCEITDRLYRVNLDSLTDDAALVQNLPNQLIAQSGNGGIHKNALFTGFQIFSQHCPDLTVYGPDNTFYGLLATNDGLYVSSLPLAAMTNDSQWQKVARTDCIGFNFLRNPTKGYAPQANAPRNKLFALYFRDGGSASAGSNCQHIFNHSSLLQAGNNNAHEDNDLAIKIGIHPDFGEQGVTDRRFFINKSQAISWVDFATHIWSDGGRRAFVRFTPNECNLTQLHFLPWDACSWNMTDSYFDPRLSSVCRIHWIENISGSGQLVAGTDRGIIVLS